MMDPNIERKYQTVIDGLGQLPSLPAVVSELLKVINHPRSSAEDASKFVEKDMGLAGKVLKLANSSYYGIPNAITNVNSAVVILGFDTIRSLVISASVVRMFPDQKGSRFDRVSFWRHSLETALTARWLARQFGQFHVDPEMLFSAGLLHDIGKLVFDQVLNSEYQNVLKDSSDHSRPLLEVETEQLGLSHADLGGMLMERWSLPEVLCSTVRNHHPSVEEEREPAEALLFLANYLSHKLGSGCIPDEPYQALPEDYAQMTGLTSEENLEALLAQAQAQLDSAAEFFELIS